MKQLFVYEENCVGCGICVDACLENVLEIIDGIAQIIYEENCTECGTCFECCPNDAIELEDI